MSNKIFILVILLLVIIAAISMAAYFPGRVDIGAKTKVADFPLAIGEWQGRDLPVDEKSYAILETRNLIMRDYENPAGEVVNLYIVYSEDNRKTSHPPEVCILGEGMDVVEKNSLQSTPGIKANLLKIEKGSAGQLAVYWYKAGDLSTNDYLRQQIKITADRALGKRTSGALIRLSTAIKEENQQAALALLQAFARQIEQQLEKSLP